MYKKYKVNKKGKNNIYIVCAIIGILLVIMSYGYALFSDSLEIKGKANIKAVLQEKLMSVNILVDNIGIVLPTVGFKTVSNTLEGSNLTTILETTDQNIYNQSGIFSFYFINTTGYDASNAKYEVKVTGSTDAIGAVTPTITASVANNGTGVFHTYVPMIAGKILVETTVDISIIYTVNGEEQRFHYYIIVKPGA